MPLVQKILAFVYYQKLIFYLAEEGMDAQMPSVFSRGVMGRGIFRVLGLSELQEAKNTIQGRERD